MTSTSSLNKSTQSLEHISLLKPARSRIDYNFFNYCAPCSSKLSKVYSRCPYCNQKV